MTAPPHATEHDDLLHAHLAGDLPADDPHLGERLATCPACRERLTELRSLTDLLERLGGEQRRSLGRPPVPAQGTERVAATLQSLSQGRAPTPLRPVGAPIRRATLWRVGLAAASVVAAGWIVKTLLPREPQPREDVLLGDGEDRSVRPSGTVERYDEIHWEQHPRDATSFLVTVRRAGEDLTGTPIVEKGVEDLPWRPDEQILALMTAAGSITIEIVAFDSQGTRMEGVRAKASIELWSR